MARRRRTSKPTEGNDDMEDIEIVAEEPVEEVAVEEPTEIVYMPQEILHPDAPNFRMYEVAKSETASRFEIDNTPPSEVLMKAQMLAVMCLQPIRNEFGGFSPQSWYRCENLERKITQNSYIKWRERQPPNMGSWDIYFARKSHPRGEAADIEIPGVPNDELFKWCKENLKFDQLIREFPKNGEPMSGWVHISYSEGRNRNEAFSIG